MRLVLGFLAIILTASAGFPSAPAEMTAHCATHGEAQPGHHGQAPEHQHHGDTHCPAHSCASTAPCTTVNTLVATATPGTRAVATTLTRITLAASRFASRTNPPTPPPPRALSA